MIPALQDCLRDNKFRNLSDVFRALIILGDKQSIPLVIERIDPGMKDNNSGYIVKQLERVTGKRYGFNREAWRHWWAEHGKTWSIPEDFLVAWDNRLQRY